MLELQKIALNNRKSIKRAIARFCLVKKIDITEEEFNTLVRRTQDSGYDYGIKYLSELLDRQMVNARDKKQLFYQFTIEYNTEWYCKQFPKGNKAVERIIFGMKTAEDAQFFKQYLYDIVKANALQLLVIERHL